MWLSLNVHGLPGSRPGLHSAPTKWCKTGKWLSGQNWLPWSHWGRSMAHTFPSQHPHSIEPLHKQEGHASIQLQAVCTLQMMFLDVVHCWPGSVHDARLFWNCPLYGHLQDVMRSDYHLLGDSAFPLSTSLITPYRDNGHLSQRQKKNN